MTDIPLPSPGDMDWNDWAAEQEDLSDAARAAVGPYRMTTGAIYAPFLSVGGNMASAAGRLYATALPIDAAPPNGIDALALRVTTAVAGASIRLAVYADTGQGFPGALALDAGTIACDTAGDKYSLVSWFPTPGLYWLVSLPLGGNPSFESAQSGFTGTGLVMRTGAAGLDDGPAQNISVNGQAALPATFPSTGWGKANQAPRIYVRTAA